MVWSVKATSEDQETITLIWSFGKNVRTPKSKANMAARVRQEKDKRQRAKTHGTRSG